MGKTTILSKARPTAMIPLLQVSVDIPTEGFPKTRGVGWAHVGDHKAFEDVTAELPNFIESTCDATRMDTAPRCPIPNVSRRSTPRKGQKVQVELPNRRGALHVPSCNSPHSCR